ncbi:methyltransferase domain-containing protein [Sphaerisporangium sp. NPDC049002]|uniref:class I SAM-dependent methyltransferase n=1 Tax=Sphaerisporangium sp. NPDC049002 TaxID=3155392 RepID=UPI0033FA8F09
MLMLACGDGTPIPPGLLTGIMDMTSVPSQRGLWDAWHAHARGADAEPVHREFIDRYLFLLPRPGEARPLLELGCGQGHDALYVAGRGYSVNALDLSAAAVERANRNLEAHPGADAVFLQHDTAMPLPFGGEAFDGVYSYLALHYFDDSTTRAIFVELHRVLRPGGTLAFCVKSVSDPLYGKGDMLEPDMYSLNGHVRHFFDRRYAADLLRSWDAVRITESQGHYLDSAAPSGLLQVIARRPSSAGAVATD